MFGEEESESPRVPSPWDSLISARPSPSSKPVSSSPLSKEIPKLVPEADDGNVEYKLQLLNPSPARFTRLVTQLKWRLLEGGGQAYYELGVADSGALLGLRRHELEMTLETLEMMAGEIGASVIVVKEIEVPADIAELASAQEKGGKTIDRETTPESGLSTETEFTTDDDDLQLNAQALSSASSLDLDVFQMDDDAEADKSDSTMELEILSVFKPRPLRKRFNDTLRPHGNKGQQRGSKLKKIKHTQAGGEAEKLDQDEKHGTKANGRSRRREKNRNQLLAAAPLSNNDSQNNNSSPCDNAESESPSSHTTLLDSNTQALVSGLESLHVSLELAPSQEGYVPNDLIPVIDLSTNEEALDEDIFPTPTIPYISTTSQKDEDGDDGKRLIVEALVVRKMSLEEAFLDFGGFSII